MTTNNAPEKENSFSFEVLPSALLLQRLLFLGKVKYEVQLSWPLIYFNAGAMDEKMGEGGIAPYSLRVLVRPTSWHTRR